MSTRSQEFRVGVLTLAVGVVATGLATLGVGVSLPGGGSNYEVQIRTDRAAGVGPNTPVRKDGVVIGRVTSTSFLAEGGVLIRAAIQRGAPIFESDRCSIRPTSLFGDAVIEFAYAGPGANVTPLDEGAMVAGAALPDPVEALTSLQLNIGPTIESISRAAESFEELSNRVNSALGEDFGAEQANSLMDEVSDSLADFRSTMQSMSQTIQKIDRLASDPEIEAAINDLPTLLADARRTVNTATETMESFAGVVTSAETNLRNLEGFTAPLGEQGEEMSQKIISAVENLDNTLAEASRFVNALSSNEGSLNRLLNDPQLYDEVLRTVNNINAVLYNFDERLKQLRPILHDVRVASDKVAREPGRILGGALNRGVGVK